MSPAPTWPPAPGAPVPVGAHATLVLAPNPGPMTLDGTNTWLLAAPGSDEVLVVDPGPDDPVHLAAIAAVVGDRRVPAVLLTHGHPDHAGAAVSAGRLFRAPVRALDPALRLGDEGLGEGDVVRVGDLEVTVVATPGHTGDSVCLTVPGAVLTGDTVLGRGSTVVAHPDGVLGDYLASLERLVALGPVTVLPGHGPVLDDCAAAATAYLAHRYDRLAQVAAAVAAGASTAEEVVAVVYADVDPVLWPAATWSVRAQLAHLRR